MCMSSIMGDKGRFIVLDDPVPWEEEVLDECDDVVVASKSIVLDNRTDSVFKYYRWWCVWQRLISLVLNGFAGV
jgi:hypothetical protein